MTRIPCSAMSQRPQSLPLPVSGGVQKKTSMQGKQHDCAIPLPCSFLLLLLLFFLVFLETIGMSVPTSGACGHVVGLSNLGNTCFFNAVVQCLARTGPLRSELVHQLAPTTEFVLPACPLLPLPPPRNGGSATPDKKSAEGNEEGNDDDEEEDEEEEGNDDEDEEEGSGSGSGDASQPRRRRKAAKKPAQ